MPAEGRENHLLKKGNSDAFFREKYLTKNNGELYRLGGKDVLAIGGAYSVDKEYRLRMGYRWFSDEQPSDEIKEYVEQQLDKTGWKVDAVLSHTFPRKYEPVEHFMSGIDQSKVLISIYICNKRLHP